MPPDNNFHDDNATAALKPLRPAAVVSQRREEEEERKRREDRKREDRKRRKRERRERERLMVTLNPDRLPLRYALVKLGKMSRSVFYDKAHLFDIYKEGSKITVGVASIDRYNASLPRAQIKRQAGA
jgi:hypothetical protein